MTQKSSSNVLFTIGDAVQNVTDEDILKASETLSEVEEGEEIIGEASDETKKLFVLQKKIVNDLRVISDEMKKKKPKNISEIKKFVLGIMDKLEEMRNMEIIYSSLMWMSIRQHLDNYSTSLGMRRGWKIVKIPEQEIRIG